MYGVIYIIGVANICNYNCLQIYCLRDVAREPINSLVLCFMVNRIFRYLIYLKIYRNPMNYKDIKKDYVISLDEN